MHKENKIDQNTLKDMLQEDAYWKSKFREWKIVNISKLKIENNEYTNAALTLEDLHSEMLESIGQ